MKRFFPLLFLLVLFSCSEPDLPYLRIDMEGTYQEGNDINVYYEFSSEDDLQPCRIFVRDVTDLDNYVWNNKDREMENEGVLNFLLGEGSYRLEFTVLSERYGELEELPFLSETRDFQVEAP